MTNLRAGIDTPEPDHALIAKLSLPSDDQEQAIAVLRAIEEVRRVKMASARTHALCGTSRTTWSGHAPPWKI